MKKSKFLYLPIEVKPRELDAKLLIAAEACSNGYSVIIGSKTINSMLSDGPVGVYFYKDSSAPLVNRFRNIRRFGHKIVVHDEEGLVQQSDDDYVLRRIMFDTIKYIDIFFCWGEHQAKLVEKVKNKFESNVEVQVTGHPRFDLLRMPLRSYNEPVVPRDSKTILINTKLAEVNHNRGETGWLDLLKSHNMLHSDSCLGLRLDQIEYKRKLFDHYKELIIALSSRYPNVDIIVRPHPSESVFVWSQFAAKLSNVYVNTQHNIGYWLNRVDLVIHTGCTTAIEAYAARLPVIAFKPIDDERFEIALPNDVSSLATNSIECLELVGNYLEDAAAYRKNDTKYSMILKPHLENVNGEFAYKKIVEALSRVDVEPQKLSVWTRGKWWFRGWLSSVRSGVVGDSRIKHRDIDSGEVRSSLNRLCASAKIEEPKVIKIKKNVYLLQSC